MKSLKLEKTFRGPVPVTSFASQLACSVDHDIAHLVPDDIMSICKKRLGKLLKTKKKTSSLGRNLKKLVVDNSFESLNLTEDDIASSVSVQKYFYLGPASKIRFKPQNPTQSWTTLQAMTSTRCAVI